MLCELGVFARRDLHDRFHSAAVSRPDISDIRGHDGEEKQSRVKRLAIHHHKEMWLRRSQLATLEIENTPRP
jgi:hypothetical protein